MPFLWITSVCMICLVLFTLLVVYVYVCISMHFFFKSLEGIEWNYCCYCGNIEW